MQRLAAFIMRGPLQAALVTVIASVLPLLGWFSATAVALVTLRKGMVSGALVIAISSAILLLFYGVQGLPLEIVLATVVQLWLPIFVLALWLRRTVSLAGTLRLAALLAGLAVVWMHTQHPDPQAFWRTLLERMLQGMNVEQDDRFWAAAIEQLAPLMTSMMVLVQSAAVVIALLAARWLQAMLYNPGGFRQEFHGLDLGRPMAAVVAALLLVAMWAGYGLVYDLAFVISAVFALQALALGHAVVAGRGSSRAWLVGMYLLLPLLFELAVVIGIADAVFNWRRRFLAGSGGSRAA
ncbi:MAG: hypothetical protein GX093_06860 [Xanthomonadaceae bacterium]|nr:hypothetical protein [Xanthomonadaceae bacterium]